MLIYSPSKDRIVEVTQFVAANLIQDESQLMTGMSLAQEERLIHVPACVRVPGRLISRYLLHLEEEDGLPDGMYFDPCTCEFIQVITLYEEDVPEMHWKYNISKPDVDFPELPF